MRMRPLAVILPIVIASVIGYWQPLLASETFQVPSTVPPATATIASQTTWERASSDYFLVRSASRSVSSAQLARLCDQLKSELVAYWFGSEYLPAKWETPSEVWVHATRQDYERIVGPGSGSTSGSSLIERKDGKIVLRRIDLRADSPDWKNSTLPHELTHVLMADRFPSKPLPRWVDEGMAIQVEPQEKRERRRQELLGYFQKQRHYDLATLTSTQNPQDHRRGAFYGQSAALVEFLVKQKSPEEFIRFIDLSHKHGQDHALREVYGRHSWHDFELAARQHAFAPLAYESPRNIVRQLVATTNP